MKHRAVYPVVEVIDVQIDALVTVDSRLRQTSKLLGVALRLLLRSSGVDQVTVDLFVIQHAHNLRHIVSTRRIL